MRAARPNTMNKSRHAPWGFFYGADGKLTANTSQAQRLARNELGETAIRVLGALGITPEQLETMLEIDDPQELIERLRAFQS